MALHFVVLVLLYQAIMMSGMSIDMHIVMYIGMRVGTRRHALDMCHTLSESSHSDGSTEYRQVSIPTVGDAVRYTLVPQAILFIVLALLCYAIMNQIIRTIVWDHAWELVRITVMQ